MAITFKCAEEALHRSGSTQHVRGLCGLEDTVPNLLRVCGVREGNTPFPQDLLSQEKALVACLRVIQSREEYPPRPPWGLERRCLLCKQADFSYPSLWGGCFTTAIFISQSTSVQMQKSHWLNYTFPDMHYPTKLFKFKLFYYILMSKHFQL